MKRFNCLLVAFALGITVAHTAPVNNTTAQKVATNFFSQISTVQISNVTLAYTETDPSNNPLFYVFNINSSDGFVIVSADDALHPIIGYSTEKRPYAIPTKGSNIDYWMQGRKTEIISNIANRVQASQPIATEWASYVNNVPRTTATPNTQRVMSSTFPSSSAYLVQSTWDQGGPYNYDCPGSGSQQAVTGCVATAMCQIMRYWQYPTIGQGSSDDYAWYYGEDVFAYFNHPYPWSTMALSMPPATDTALSRAMSDIGVSLQMSYTPTGSGSEVITSDDPYASAQNSYVQFFNYSPNILDGLHESNVSSMTAWQDTLKHELDRGRPIQYAGFDATAGGHSWVCDGYDASNNFHMNWGWSGMDDGWYALDNLNPQGFDFIENEEALIGIMPPPVTAKPAASFTASQTGCTNNYAQYVDVSTNQPTSWNWTFTGGTPSTSTDQDPVVSYSTEGFYSVKLVVKNSHGADSTTVSNYITIYQAPTAPTIIQNGSMLSASPTNYSQYEWIDDNIEVADGAASQLQMYGGGVYTVIVTDSHGCSSRNDLVVLTLGVNTLNADTAQVSVYPNPTTGNINLEINTVKEGDYTLSVCNILGQTLYTDNLHLTGLYHSNMDMTNYGKGVYFISIKGNNSSMVKKVIVE